ncbi:uncharacterized protein [Drosophila bipectinata]|uniref:uncharacterized protein n=1 Tax=Drosophila bipectinata TaxID=42026 RepID=UPI0038B358B1
MSNIKYHIIAVDELQPIEENNNYFLQRIVKFVLCFLIILTIVLYTWDPTKDRLESTTFSFPTTFQEVSDLKRATIMQESFENSLNSSEIMLQNSYQVGVQHNMSGLIVKANDSSIDLEAEETIMSYIPNEKKQTPDVNGSVSSFTAQPKPNMEIFLENDPQEDISNASYPLETESHVKYFVNSPQCKMLQPDPFAKNIMKIYNKKYYTVCDHSPDMVTVNYNWTDSTYSLIKNESSASCCYKRILRAGVRTGADQHYTLHPCIKFEHNFVVPRDVEAMITECRRSNATKVSQTDAFAFVHPRNDSTKTESRRPSVLLLGIDSVSRMNLQLTMPQMYKYLASQHWFEMQGYNKVGDNTFPNLMAVLTGLNKTYAITRCRPDEVGGLDACPFIWKDFKAKGYTTAFAEDWSPFSTFDYLKRGFRVPPTDVYARPLVMAVEKELNATYESGMPHCLGRRLASEYIYDLAVEFTKVNRNRTFFGMFWTNTFSHNNFAQPSSMDDRMVKYMRTLDKNGVMDNTIILFFSDHGSRFGPLRRLSSGFLEERLPFMFIRLPRWIREKYPHFVKSLEANRNRLTSPYDIYAMFKHILDLDKKVEQLPRPNSCPSCHSIFEEVDWSRSCHQAGIDKHWCGCNSIQPVSKDDATAKSIAEQLVQAINGFLAENKGAKKCQKLKLKNASSVQRRSNSSAYLVQFYANPGGALFEATADWDADRKKVSVSVPSISRLESYDSQSHCTSVKEAKKFCIC